MSAGFFGLLCVPARPQGGVCVFCCCWEGGGVVCLPRRRVGSGMYNFRKNPGLGGSKGRDASVPPFAMFYFGFRLQHFVQTQPSPHCYSGLSNTGMVPLLFFFAALTRSWPGEMGGAQHKHGVGRTTRLRALNNSCCRNSLTSNMRFAIKEV